MEKETKLWMIATFTIIFFSVITMFLLTLKNMELQGELKSCGNNILENYSSQTNLNNNNFQWDITQNDTLYCYPSSSEPICNKIILKNGTEIIQNICFQNANIIFKCINKSDIKSFS